MFAGIFGFPGSGTHYMSAFLRSYGLDIQHEKIGAAGICSWYHFLPEYQPTEVVSRGPSKEGRNRRLVQHGIPFTPVVHLIRHPWQAIASAACLPSDWIAVLRNNTKQDAIAIDTWESRATVCIRAYTQWYDKIRELNPEFTLRIETLQSRWDEVREVFKIAPAAFTIWDSEKAGSRQRDPLYRPLSLAVAAELDENAALRVDQIRRNLKYDR